MAQQYRSIKTNFLLSVINTVLGVIFPLITIPYIARVIAPEGIGQVQFFTTIIDYIILITSLGIPLYAVREIAKNRDDIEKRNQLAVDFLFLHLCLVFIGYIIVGIIALTVSKVQANLPLFLLLSIGIFLNAIGLQWFFQGTEDFVYITIRSLIVKLICLILLFVFVKNKNDLLMYGFIQLLGTGGNYVFNFIRFNTQIDRYKKYIKNFSFKRHISPTLKVFLLNVTVGIYTQMSFLLLGFIKGNEAVSYFSMPYRIISVALCVITALGTVLLPRFSNYIGNNKGEEFTVLGNKAISLILSLILPMTVGLYILAKPITLILFGEAFYPSIDVLKWLALLVTIIGLSQVYGKYMLYSLGHEILMVVCTSLGLLVYLLVGIPLIIHFSEIGASLAALLSEICVAFSLIFFGRKYLNCTIIRRQNLNYVVASLIMSLFVGATLLLDSNLLCIIIGLIAGITSYSICLAVMKDNTYVECKYYFKTLIKRK